MCHKETVSRWRYLLVAALAAGALAAQTAPVEWRRVGNPSIEVGLASPATGPVQTVWYSPDGARLYRPDPRRTAYSKPTISRAGPLRKELPNRPIRRAPAVDRMPEAGAKLAGCRHCSGTRLRPRDATLPLRRWRPFLDEPDRFPQPIDYRPRPAQCRGFSRRSGPIGGGQRFRRLALDGWRPVVVGVESAIAEPAGQPYSGHAWGRAWSRILVPDLGVMELAPGAEAWQPTSDAPAAAEATLEENALRRASQALGIRITAVAASGQTVYAGAADGRIWVSSTPAEAGPLRHGPAQTGLSSGSLPIRASRAWLWPRWAAPARTCCALPTAADSGTI